MPKLLFIILLAASCQTVEGTGRSQLNFISLKTEMRMGLQAYREVLDDSEIVTQGPDAEMVNRVGARVAAAAVQLYPKMAKKFRWEFSLIREDKTINAWALPGGKCAVYTGLLPVTADEESLAVVIGHEVAHAIARHGGERMSTSLALMGALVGTDLLWDANDEDKKQNIMMLLGISGTLGTLAFSREHESEADQLGLYLCATAGYNPQAAIGLWERMAESGGGSPPEFLSTHPSENTRIKRLKTWMPKARAMFDAAPKDQPWL